MSKTSSEELFPLTEEYLIKALKKARAQATDNVADYLIRLSQEMTVENERRFGTDDYRDPEVVQVLADVTRLYAKQIKDAVW